MSMAFTHTTGRSAGGWWTGSGRTAGRRCWPPLGGLAAAVETDAHGSLLRALHQD